MNLRQQFFWKVLLGLSAIIILFSLFQSYSKYSEYRTYRKEYEKEAKFWKDFSTTYSQQYLKAAGEVYDIATTAQSNHQLDIIDKSEEYKKFSQGASKLNNLSSYEQQQAMLEAYRD